MKLVKILSDSIQIPDKSGRVSDVRINHLLTVSDRSVSLVAMVSGLTDTDAEEHISDDDFLAEITTPKQ